MTGRPPDRPGPRVDPLGDAPAVKCLLVDDLDENLLAISALLARDGVELLLARSGREALELLLLHEVALAFVDVQMPEMDGFELAELMRGSERTRHVPIIFVTAGAHDLRRMFKGYENGAVDFLFKPIEPHIIESKARVFFQLYRQNQQLARQLQAQTETLRLNEMFTAVLGHDLRTPLSAILLSAELLQRRSTEPAVQAVVARLQSSGKWMNRMIDDMLDLARGRLGGGIPLERKPTGLDELVERAVQEHQDAFPGRPIEVQQDGDLVGAWDADRLTQVASNLIGNALRHGDAAQPVAIRLDGQRPDTVVLEVTNSGAIAPELLPHLFDPFRSRRRRPSRADGLGLGLYIVHEIVRAHGGTVQVSSDGQLSRFVVTLPRQ